MRLKPQLTGLTFAMTGHIRSLRPARAAIAAVLAISSPTLFAQTVIPPAQPVIADPPVAQTQPAASPAPVFAPSQPVVQSTPSVEQRLDAAITASQAEEAQAVPAAAAVKRNASRPAGRTIARTEPVAAPQRSEPLAQREAPSPAPPAPAPSAPLAEAVAPAAPAAPERQAPPASSEARTDPALLLALGGGSLLMIGLAAAALMRRRARRQEVEHWDGEIIQPEPVQAARQPVPAMPLMTPSPAVAPVLSEEERTLDAMVAAPPSPENPFRTHAKRRTRAKFLLAQRQKQVQTPMVAESVAPTESPRLAPTATQTVYRFGSDRRREGVFKPRTS